MKMTMRDEFEIASWLDISGWYGWSCRDSEYDDDIVHRPEDEPYKWKIEDKSESFRAKSNNEAFH